VKAGEEDRELGAWCCAPHAAVEAHDVVAQEQTVFQRGEVVSLGTFEGGDTALPTASVICMESVHVVLLELGVISVFRSVIWVDFHIMHYECGVKSQ